MPNVATNPPAASIWFNVRVTRLLCPYIPEFYVKIAYASKFVMNNIREIARESVTNFRTREKEEKLNDEKLRKEYALESMDEEVGKCRKCTGLKYVRENVGMK